jgi:DNA helicase-4
MNLGKRVLDLLRKRPDLYAKEIAHHLGSDREAVLAVMLGGLRLQVETDGYVWKLLNEVSSKALTTLSGLLDREEWRNFDEALSSLKPSASQRERELCLRWKAEKITLLIPATIKLDENQARILASPAKTIRVTARAGSGKTRLLKAIAYFSVRHLGYDPAEVLLLAFNRDAAKQLEAGLMELLGLPAFPGARTFHALAYGIAQSEKKVVYNEGTEIGAMQLTSLVENVMRKTLDDETRASIYQIFRAETEIDLETGALLSGAAHYDFRRNLADLTLGGDYVKSRGEKFIADFLFELGIEYEYEKYTSWDGGRYQPDFTITAQTGTFIWEHWAVHPDAVNVAPTSDWPASKVETYQHDARRKREYWKKKKIPLVETWAQEIGERGEFESTLHERLAPYLGRLKKLPDDALQVRVVKKHLSTLSKWVAQAIQRAQKRGWSVEDLKSAIAAHGAQGVREQLFLKIVARTFPAYEQAMEREGQTDFDRLFNDAISLMQADPPQTLMRNKSTAIDLRAVKICLVDEAQDLSLQFQQALECIRAFNPAMRIVFVGDDWQAINRFAGSSVAIFSNKLSERFGKCAPARLDTNYRSCHSIVEAGNKSMSGLGNPAVSKVTDAGRIERAYYDKTWIHFMPDMANPEQILRDEPFDKSPLVKTLYQLAMPDLVAGKTVGVLFRTNNFFGTSIDDLRNTFFRAIKAFGWPKPLVEEIRDQIRFSTAHKFKGEECQTIFVVDPHEGSFPLIMPSSIELFQLYGDSLEQALEDERRLFYVAITRACERLVFLCDSARLNESPFLESIATMITNISVSSDIILPKQAPPEGGNPRAV